MNHILLAINDNYFEQAKVLLFSIFLSNAAKDFHFHLFESELGTNNKEYLKKYVNAFGSEIDYYHIDPADFIDAPQRDNISIETYFRLFAPEVLIKLDKILYMDVDTVVTGAIHELFEIDMSEYSIAGIEDQGDVKNDLYHKHQIGLRKDSKYINGGVLMMNLNRIRERVNFAQIIDFVNKNKSNLKYQDQDIINVFFQNDLLILPERYNKAPFFHSVNDYLITFFFERFSNRGAPEIIHYMGDLCKPWREEGYGLKYYKLYRKMCLKAGCMNLYRRVRKNGGFRRLSALNKQYVDFVVSGME